MYSMVLMAALTTGGETPDIGRRGGRGGCCGCTGGMAYGGGRRGGRRGGGCYGGGYGGCYGGGMGYGYGGCYGGMGYGGGWGGCYGGGMGYGYGGMAYGGCYGGGMAYGGMGYPVSGGCYGGTYMGTGGVIQGAGTGGEQIQKMPKPDKKGSGEESMAPAPATILVTLPADARLSVDGKPTTSTSTSRAFVSPDLPRGREFHYTLKAEIVRDGKPVSVTREVAVRAGETIPVTINIPPTGVARR